MEIKIKEYVKILFHWNGTDHEVTLNEKDFNPQLDRFYADFEIDGERFYFEDDLKNGCPIIRMSGVWHIVDENEEEYFNHLHEILEVA